MAMLIITTVTSVPPTMESYKSNNESIQNENTSEENDQERYAFFCNIYGTSFSSEDKMSTGTHHNAVTCNNVTSLWIKAFCGQRDYIPFELRASASSMSFM